MTITVTNRPGDKLRGKSICTSLSTPSFFYGGNGGFSSGNMIEVSTGFAPGSVTHQADGSETATGGSSSFTGADTCPYRRMQRDVFLTLKLFYCHPEIMLWISDHPFHCVV